MTHFFNSNTLKNLFSLYGLQFSAYISPLLVFPYLARTLSPNTLGILFFSQSFSAWLAMLIEFGFNLSGTRQVARNRHSNKNLSYICSGVLGAKFCIIILILASDIFFLNLVDIFRFHPAYLVGATFQAISIGMSPAWFFLGVERISKSATVETLCRVIPLAGVFLFVHNDQGGALVLFLQAAGGLCAVVPLHYILFKEVGFSFPSANSIKLAFREGFSLFAFKGITSTYTSINAFLLGILSNPLQVAIFGGAEKVVRTLVLILNPINQTIYPRITHLLTKQRESAKSIFHQSFLAMFALGSGICLTTIIASKYVIHILMGANYAATVPLLEIFSLVIPGIAISNCIGIQWLIPNSRENHFIYAVLSGAFLNLLIVFLTVHRFGAIAMAYSQVAAEWIVAAICVLFYAKSRRKLKPK